MISSTRRTGVLAAYPRLAELSAATTAGDRRLVGAELEDLRGSHEQDHWLGCSIVAESPGADALISAWVRDEPDSPQARLLAGHHAVVAAWRIRTSKRASAVSMEQFAGFHRGLVQAEQILLELCAREPDLPAPWAVRITSARGLELGESESARRFARLREIDPHHLAGHLSRLQQVLPKWGAPDFTPARTLAREAASAGRPELGLDVLIAELVVEQWIETGTPRRMPQDLRAELDAGSDRLLASGLAAAYSGFEVHSTFANAHCITRDSARAVAHLQRLGAAARAFPIDTLGDSHQGRLKRMRAKALRSTRSSS